MNASHRTRIIARGIYLYAVVQDMPAKYAHDSKEAGAWREWCNDNGPAMEDFVRQAQFNLFDSVNAHKWED